jgi:hypothetical protein
MSVLTWPQVGEVYLHRLSEARRQAHNAAQWLARMAHSYMLAEPENRHMLLRWDEQRQALVTREFLPKFTLELRLPNLALQFKENGRPAPHVVEIDDRTPAEVEAWVLVELLHRGIDRDRFSKALPYEIPNLMTGDAIPYVIEGMETELGQLAGWFTNAAALLERIDEEYHSPAPPAGLGAWCWPELFHMVTMVTMRPGRGSPGGMLCAGWSPGNGAHCEPYFYVTPQSPAAWPSVDDEMTATEIMSMDRPTESVLDFLRRAIDRRRMAD